VWDYIDSSYDDGDDSSYDDNICSDSYGSNNICDRDDGYYSNDYIDSSYIDTCFLIFLISSP
jgi:hypothetical protein